LDKVVNVSHKHFDSFHEETKCNGAGEFELWVDFDKAYLLVASLDRHASRGQIVVVLSDKKLAPVEMSLEPATRVFGTLKNLDDSQPLPGKHLTLQQLDGDDYYKMPEEDRLPERSRKALQLVIVQHAKADAQGRFEFFAGKGRYTLYADGIPGGSGVYIADKHARIINSTIVLNRTLEQGGGIFVADQTDTSCVLYNTIVAGNRFIGSSTFPDDIGGKAVFHASSYNLIGDTATAGGLIDGTNHNIVGNSGQGTLPVGQVLVTTLEREVGRVPTHRPRPASQLIDAGGNQFAVGLDGQPLLNDARGVPRIRPAEAGRTAIVDIGAVEVQPPQLALRNEFSYTEDQPPVPLDPAALLQDLDSPNFNRGVLNVRSEEGDDVLTIGTGNQVTVVGSEVRFNGVVIGAQTGHGTDSLRIEFSEQATLPAVQAVLRSLQFSCSSDGTVGGSVHLLRVSLSDGDGGVSGVRTVRANVSSPSAAPVLSNIPASQSYTQEILMQLLGRRPAITDNSLTLDGGSLRVTATQNFNAATDRLFISSSAAHVEADGTVIVGQTSIGHVEASEGRLHVTFNASATLERVVTLMKSVRLRIMYPTTPDSRVFSVSVIDSEGLESNVVETTVHV